MTSHSFCSVRILATDLDLREELSRLATSIGATSTVVSDPLEMLHDHPEEGTPAVLLVDAAEWSLPGGESALHRIAREASTPLVVVGAADAPDDGVVALTLCADAYLETPLSAGRLEVTLKLALAHHGGGDASRLLRHAGVCAELVRQTSDVILICTYPDGALVEANRAFSSFFGYSTQDARGQSATDLNLWHSIRDRDRFRENLLEHEGHVVDTSIEFRRRDGSHFWASLSTFPVRIGGDAYLLCTIRNIDPLIDARQALTRTERWLLAVLKSVGDGVITTDRALRITFINPEAQRLCGLRAEAARGRDVRDVMSLRDPISGDVVENPAYKALSLGKPCTLQDVALLRGADGIERPIADSAAPIIADSGEIEGAALVFRDMTEQQRMAQRLRVQQRLEALGTLAGGVAHEINNPINIILNAAELIRMDAAEGTEPWQLSASIVQESHRVAAIVRDLLAFARQDADQVEEVYLADILDSSIGLVRKIIRRDGILFTVAAPETPLLVPRPGRMLQQVLVNLLLNARDAVNERYGDAGDLKRIALDASVESMDDGRWLHLRVKDNGVGIPPEYLDRIFDPFFTTKAPGVGTGLGLSISYAIMREGGGRLRVDSRPGEGACMHVELPLPPDVPDVEFAST